MQESLGAVTKLRDDAGLEFREIKGAMQRMMERTERMLSDMNDEEPNFGGSGKGGKGCGKSRLLNPKENPVYKLKDNCTRDEFLHWKRNVEVHLESIGGWSGATKVLRKIRLNGKEVSLDDYSTVINGCYADDQDDPQKEKVWTGWRDEFSERSKELYIFLLPKLSTSLAILLSQVDAMNGFELWRLINQEEDPVRNHARFHMENDIRQLTAKRCKNFKDTIELMTTIEKKAK